MGLFLRKILAAGFCREMAYIFFGLVAPIPSYSGDSLAERILKEIKVNPILDLIGAARNGDNSCSIEKPERKNVGDLSALLKKLDGSIRSWEQEKANLARVLSCNRSFDSGFGLLRQGREALLEDLQAKVSAVRADLENSIEELGELKREFAGFRKKPGVCEGGYEELTQFLTGARNSSGMMVSRIRLMAIKLVYRNQYVGREDDIPEKDTVLYQLETRFRTKRLRKSCAQEYRRALEGLIALTRQVSENIKEVSESHVDPWHTEFDFRDIEAQCALQKCPPIDLKTNCPHCP